MVSNNDDGGGGPKYPKLALRRLCSLSAAKGGKTLENLKKEKGTIQIIRDTLGGGG